MKLFSVLSLILFFYSTLASATNISGVWYGTGELKNRHRKIPCEIFMDVTQTETTFSINGGGYICDDYNVEYPSSSFDIRDRKLYYQEELAGEVLLTGIKIFSEFEPGLWFYLTLSLGERGFQFHERWEVEGSELYVYGDALQLQNN